MKNRAFLFVMSTAFACSPKPQGEGDTPPGHEGPLGVEVNFTVCGEDRFPHPLGGTSVDVERYDFDQLTEELAQDSALQMATGLVRVASCEDARKLVSARIEGDVEAPWDEPVLPPSTEPADAIGTTTHGIWNGEPSSDQRIIYIRIPVDLGSPGDAHPGSSFSECSAIAFSERHLLTAAHCIPSQALGFWRVRAFRGDSSGSDKGEPVLLGNFRAYIYRHAAWSGTGDSPDDVALISMQRKCVTNNERDAVDVCTGTPWLRAKNNTNLMRLWLGNFSLGMAMAIKGFGTTSRYSLTAPRLHYGDDGAEISVDWTHSRYFLTDDEQKAIICNRDSGGPAMMTRDWASYAAGVLSSMSTLYGQECSNTTGWRRQKWHRIGGTFESWTEPKLAGNPWFQCPGSGDCCLRGQSANAYTNLANHEYARCW